ncbi:hypothetical protein DL96DRAFT_1710357 [Flagelloscypha sp. PMI_526]|nr:hypothetical protein DL96DRAFT_1710357 [Flagelloscypha sp. PMI_526]
MRLDLLKPFSSTLAVVSQSAPEKTIGALPSELWLEVIQYLPNDVLFRLRSLNSTFWNVSWARKYECLDLTSELYQEDKDLIPRALRLVRFTRLLPIYQNPQVSKHVKTLRLARHVEHGIWDWNANTVRLTFIPVLLVVKGIKLAWRQSKMPSVNPNHYWAQHIALQITDTICGLPNLQKLYLVELNADVRHFTKVRGRFPSQCVYMSQALLRMGPTLVHLVLDGPKTPQDIPSDLELPSLTKFEAQFGGKHLEASWIPILKKVLCQSNALSAVSLTYDKPSSLTVFGLPLLCEGLRFPSLRSFKLSTSLNDNLCSLMSPSPHPETQEFLLTYSSRLTQLDLGLGFGLSDDSFTYLNLGSLRTLLVPLQEDQVTTFNRVIYSAPNECVLQNLCLRLRFPLVSQLSRLAPISDLQNLTIRAPLIRIDLLLTLPLSVPNLKTLLLIAAQNLWGTSEANITAYDINFTRTTSMERLIRDARMLNSPTWETWGLQDLDIHVGTRSTVPIVSVIANQIPTVKTVSGMTFHAYRSSQ